jgi:hypothetical protein
VTVASQDRPVRPGFIIRPIALEVKAWGRRCGFFPVVTEQATIGGKGFRSANLTYFPYFRLAIPRTDDYSQPAFFRFP